MKKILSFALIGNGTYFNCAAQLKQYDIVIALDGGANYCRTMKVSPDYSIGDGDSITVQSKTFLHDPDQNTTDLQKGLKLCKKLAGKKQYTIDLFCCTSEDRLDHTQAAMQVLIQYTQIHCLITATTTIYYLRSQRTITLSTQPGDSVSCLPLTHSATVQLAGLHWSGTVKLNQQHSGIANIATSHQIKIYTQHGKILLYIKQKA